MFTVEAVAMGNCLRRTKAERREKLNNYLNKLYQKISFDWNDENCEIREAVIELVHIIVSRTEDSDQRLKIQDVILVESTAEDTQIQAPSEFDFQLVLDAFSKPGSLQLLRNPENRGLYAHIRLLHHNLKLEWKSSVENDCLK